MHLGRRRRGERDGEDRARRWRGSTFGLNRSVRGDAAITASAPAPSALRRTAPTLPGFSTPSMTTTSGSSGSARSARSSRRDAGDGDEALGALAEGELGEDRLAGRLDRDVPARAGDRARRARRARPAAARRRTPRRSRRPASSARRTSRAPSTASGRSGRARAGRAGPSAALTRGLARLVRIGGAGEGIGRHHAPPGDRAKAPSSSGRPSPVVRSRRRPRSRRPAGASAVASSAASRSGLEARRCARSAGRSRPARGAAAHAARRPQVVLDAPRAARRAVPVARRVEDDPGVAAAARTSRSAKATRVVDDPADRAIGKAGAARRCGAPTRRSAGRRRRGRPRRPPRPGPASRGPCTRTGGGRRARRRRPRPAPRPARRSHGSIAACSGKSPTWPASVARSSSVSPSISIGHGSATSAGPGPAPVAIEAQVGRRATARDRRGPQGRRVRPVDDPRPEPLEPGTAADVDELVAPLRPAQGAWSGGHQAIERARRAPDSAGPTAA